MVLMNIARNSYRLRSSVGHDREIENEVVALLFPRLRHDISLRFWSSGSRHTGYGEVVADFGLMSWRRLRQTGTVVSKFSKR